MGIPPGHQLARLYKVDFPSGRRSAGSDHESIRPPVSEACERSLGAVLGRGDLLFAELEADVGGWLRVDRKELEGGELKAPFFFIWERSLTIATIL